AQGAAPRARPGGAASGDRRGPAQPGRDRRAERADPHLQLSANPRHRSSHRAHAASSADRARGRSGRADRRARGGRGSRALAGGGALRAAVPPLRDELDAATSTLEAAGVPEARVDAEWLLAGLMGLGRARLRMDLGREVSAALARRFVDAVSRRVRREPLQRILGWEEFRGLRLRLTDAVLVPRPETGALVEWAPDLLPPAGARPR